MTEPHDGHAPAMPIHTIRTGGEAPLARLRELLQHHELLLLFAWRDIKLRYAQTAFGIAWVLIQPAVSVAIIAMVFGVFMRVPSDGVPYPLFALAGFVPWLYFSSALAAVSNSMVGNEDLLRRVYFPRLVLPFAAMIGGLVDFAIGAALVLLALLAYGRIPSLSIVIWLPVSLLLIFLTLAGVGCWLAALNVPYRDVRHTVPFLLQAWLYATPVVYPVSIVPHEFRFLVAVNPIATAIEGIRSGLFGIASVDASMLAVSFGMAVLLFLSGVTFFQRMERSFVDVV